MNSTARFVIIVCATIAVVGIVKARTVTLVMRQPEDSSQRWDPPDSVAAYDAECRAGTVSAQCAALRGAITFQIVSALENISIFYEPGDEQAAALALDVREPEVKEAALRVLARKHDKAVEPKLLSIVLGDPSWELQRMSASALASSPDGNLRDIGSQWTDNHVQQIGVVPDAKLPALLWAESARPTPAEVGFAAYAGAATRYPPGESDRAIAFSTKDPVDTVVAFYAKSMKTKPLDLSGWAAWVNAHQSAYYPPPDPAALADVQQRLQVKSAKYAKLVEEFVKTNNKKLEEQMQKLQAEIDADAKALDAAMPKPEDRPGVLPVRIASPGNVGAKIFVDETQKRAARLVCIYRQDGIGATVIQLVWDPKLVVRKRRP